ncbi:URC4/urg3 family protein [Spirulina subsalsa FACHB-351]|uniref:URC4/urg3 family protein n=1 Tax=Spirulina subsalsa FACHB-351 TaxID=234711 RepID=A0ABT3L6I2_9CYAN|nr:URC4/urg3 family protein [Spirulina subsalsa]MCW6037052.1 URC4/urg3 family protein [Spirulina subsalsa FACHB-351]
MTPPPLYLQTPFAIRQRCDLLFQKACQNELDYFFCDLTQLDAVTEYVLKITQETYPDFQIPFHSRWRHFGVGNYSRLAELKAVTQTLSPLEQAKVLVDLVIVSVLLDAGAGEKWQYFELQTGQMFQRSEGLAVASFRMFCSGAFSSYSSYPLQVDSLGLEQLDLGQLKEQFQVSSENPLVGLEGRLKLLQKLGKVMRKSPELFGEDCPRLGNLVNYWLSQQDEAGKLSALTVFNTVIQGLGEIWPGRFTLEGINLGDVWQHSAIPDDHFVPFHKLSQWLTYSLLEPLESLGLKIKDLDQLTGLAEYRNGGLCIDLGLLQVKQPDILEVAHVPSSEVIVEWRGLTVILLDKIAEKMREKLQLTTAELPLVKVLQGGTWTAGRRIAAQLRQGLPPLRLESDGTVF